jgi:hypothetical protein
VVVNVEGLRFRDGIQEDRHVRGAFDRWFREHVRECHGVGREEASHRPSKYSTSSAKDSIHSGNADGEGDFLP